tara:strand:- start:3219 stop:5957 length:2739 start_codon:yes stop_codon:yes gene_type:complete
MDVSEKKLFLLDGMALIYRAYFAFFKNPRLTSKGDDVSAIFGFLNTLLEIQKKHNPSHIAVAFDLSGPTFRHELYPSYKANRDETPDAIKFSIPIIKKLLESLSIPILEMKGFEADDIIGTVAKKASKEKYETFMVTPDKDYAQLVNDNTYMLKPARGGKEEEIITRNDVIEQWNINHIHQVIDILGLAGDSVDNIPGIPGIGPKTAQKLILEYDSIENIIKNTEKLKGKQKENVENFKDDALISKELATIKCDVPIDFSLENLIQGERNDDKLKEILISLEFRTFLKRFFENDSISEDENLPSKNKQTYNNINNTKHNYKILYTEEECRLLAFEMLNFKEVAIDLETTSLNIRTASIIGISFCFKKGLAYYIPISLNLDEAKTTLNIFKDFLLNKNISKIGQNIKFDYSILKRYGYKINGDLLDTMIAHYLLDPSLRHNMDFMSKSELNYEPISFTSLIGEKKNNFIDIKNVPVEKIGEYAAEDADITFQLWEILKKKLAIKNLEKVFYDIEIKLISVLSEMEINGIKLNENFLEKYSVILEEKIVTFEKSIFKQAGMPFNVNSPKQLGEVLFDVLKIIENPKKTKTGQYQTGEEILSELATEHKIVSDIQNYRQLVKLKSTYVDALPDEICKISNRIHTTFSQTITSTGRLSSSNPNLQNIPIKTEEGREIRKSFLPKEGCLLLACDYSQIELRVMAELSKDINLSNAFKNGLDVHTDTASKIFNVQHNKVTREMRNKAKMTNFGIIYGISAFGLSKRLNIPRSEASSIIEEYRKLYPGIQNYLSETINFAQKNEFVETITGRRRYIRDINAKNKMIRAGAERNAINAPIQGTAADMIKIAMININNFLNSNNFQTKMLLQVHDELVFDLFPSEKDILIPKIEELMQNAINLDVPITVQSGVGNNWLEAH